MINKLKREYKEHHDNGVSKTINLLVDAVNALNEEVKELKGTCDLDYSVSSVDTIFDSEVTEKVSCDGNCECSCEKDNDVDTETAPITTTKAVTIEEHDLLMDTSTAQAPPEVYTEAVDIEQLITKAKEDVEEHVKAMEEDTVKEPVPKKTKKTKKGKSSKK